MKKSILSPLVAALVAAGMAGHAAATPIDQLFNSRNANPYLITDLSGEIAINGPNSDANKIDVGDVLLGGLGFESFSNPNSPIVLTGRELTGLFATAVTNSAVVNTTVSDYVMGAAGASFWANQGYTQAGFGDAYGVDMNQVAGLLFEDAAGGFDRGNGIAAGLAEAQDGTLRAILGFDNVDDYWVARGPTALSTFGPGGSSTSPLGQFNFGVSFLYENISQDFLDQAGGLDQPAIDTTYSGSTLFSPFSANAQMLGDGSLFRPSAPNTGVTDPFPIYNKVDATVSSIPEPSMMALIGLGLLGAGGLGRRFRKA